MLMFIWMWVMTAAFVPGGAQWASAQSAAVEEQLRAELETASLARPGAAIGAAEAFVRATPLMLAR